ncbi:MAG: MarR family transcriptional regulator [Flavobacteriaceae bacterium]|jgi:MarR family transcriptional regulator, organic hydroperoxide resistance regulator|nr:MarR family transcriptional regulator [Flavobacteriaceae bacterium]|tara:strand:+ start:1515 stop:1961 length:447 start_codon:yes stop_codon:yes gene_type:complete
MNDNITRIDPVEYSLRTSWQSIKMMYQEEATKYGHTYAIGFALLSIDPKKGTSSTSIAPIMGLEANSLSRLLKTMEINKLIIRKPNPNDGRGVIILLTKEGLKKRDITKNKVIKFNRIIKENITKKDLTILLEATKKIKKLISENTIF